MGSKNDRSEIKQKVVHSVRNYVRLFELRYPRLVTLLEELERETKTKNT